MSDGQLPTDGDRLRAFIREGDQAAFEAVVNRHGPMVLRVCHGILGDPHEAQDAAQAVFLVLARKASRLEGDVSVAPWLHRVAHDLAVDTVAVVAQSQAPASRDKAAGGVGVGVGTDDSRLKPELSLDLGRRPKAIVGKKVPFVINTRGRHPLFSDGHGTVFADVYERTSNLFYTVSVQDPNGSLTKGPWPLHAGPGWFMYVDAPDLWVFDGDETVQLVRLFSHEQSHGLSDRTVKEFPEIMKTAPGPFIERLPSNERKTHFDPVRLESAPVVVRARVKPHEKGAVGSVGPAMTRFSTLVIGEVIKNTSGQALAAGAEIGLAHDQREPLPVGEFTAYLKTETLKLSGKEHVRYNFTGAAAEGSRYPGAGQGTSHHVTGQ